MKRQPGSEEPGLFDAVPQEPSADPAAVPSPSAPTDAPISATADSAYAFTILGPVEEHGEDSPADSSQDGTHEPADPSPHVIEEHEPAIETYAGPAHPAVHAEARPETPLRDHESLGDEFAAAIPARPGSRSALSDEDVPFTRQSAAVSRRWPFSRKPFVYDPERASRRVLLVGRFLVVLITLVLLGLLGRVAQLQTQPPPQITELINSQKSTVSVMGRRGNLLDRQGRVLRTTQVAKKLFVDPQSIEDYAGFAEKVGYTLGIDPVMIDRKISEGQDRQYIVLDRRLSDERLAKFSSIHRLRGIGLDPYLVREYPVGALASNVLGFVGAEGKGLDGLERVFDKELAGIPGRMTYYRDVRHRPIWIDPGGYLPPSDGESVRLSLDVIIQEIAENELKATCKEFGALQGEIIVMAPRTGEILAMANYPSFDPNRLDPTKPDLWRNRAVTDVYEPGSTFKPFVWAAAINWNIARPNEMFNCHGGYWVSPGGRHLRDAHGYGMLSWEDVLVKSSNIGMAQVGLRMGNKKLHQAITSFGFGKSSGSGLPGEVWGIVNPLKLWNPVYSPTSVPMGQEVAVTPLQMTKAFCTLSNGGLSVTPSIRARDAADAGRTAPIVERVVSRKAADITKATLRRVVIEGTGKLANSPHYELFGKTGTAQVPDRKSGGYLPGAYVGSFVCGAPVDDPQVVVICVIHQPDKRKGYYGGIVAAPAAKRVVEQTLLYMGVPPTQHEPDDQPKLVRQ